MATVDVSATNADGVKVNFPYWKSEITNTHPFHQVPLEVYNSISKKSSNDRPKVVPKFFSSFRLPLILAMDGFSMLPAMFFVKLPRPDAAMFSQRVRAFSRKLLMALLVVSAVSVSAPNAQAAKITLNADGKTMHVKVEKNDNFGSILLQAGYTKMSLWGPRGVVAKMANIVKDKISNVNFIYTGETFDLPLKSQVYIEKTPISKLYKKSSNISTHQRNNKISSGLVKSSVISKDSKIVSLNENKPIVPVINMPIIQMPQAITGKALSTDTTVTKIDSSAPKIKEDTMTFNLNNSVEALNMHGINYVDAQITPSLTYPLSSKTNLTVGGMLEARYGDWISGNASGWHLTKDAITGGISYNIGKWGISNITTGFGSKSLFLTATPAPILSLSKGKLTLGPVQGSIFVVPQSNRWATLGLVSSSGAYQINGKWKLSATGGLYFLPSNQGNPANIVKTWSAVLSYKDFNFTFLHLPAINAFEDNISNFSSYDSPTPWTESFTFSKNYKFGSYALMTAWNQGFQGKPYIGFNVSLNRVAITTHKHAASSTLPVIPTINVTPAPVKDSSVKKDSLITIQDTIGLHPVQSLDSVKEKDLIIPTVKNVQISSKSVQAHQVVSRDLIEKVHPTVKPSIKIDTSNSANSSSARTSSSGSSPPPPPPDETNAKILQFMKTKWPLYIGMAILGMGMGVIGLGISRKKSKKQKIEKLKGSNQTFESQGVVIISSPKPADAALEEQGQNKIPLSLPSLNTDDQSPAMITDAAQLAPSRNIFDFLPKALLFPFLILSRTSYTLQVWIHEMVHLFVAVILHLGQWKEILNISNLKANLNLSQWGELFNHTLQKNPYVTFPAQDAWKDNFIRKSGFVGSFVIGFGILSALGVASFFQPWFFILMLPVFMGTWDVIKESWIKDVVAQDAQMGKYECGNYGIFWVDKSNEGINPGWVSQGLNGILSRLVVRGGQSAGQAFIDDRFDGQEKVFLTKVVKSKRGPGSNLAQSILKKFNRSIDSWDNTSSMNAVSILGINGHVRYATGGPVLREASHPFAGPQEERIQWELKNGQFQAVKRNVFVIASHNGDNDTYRLLDRKLGLDEIRDFFTQVVHFKGELPPGDSPSIPLEIHFHLTQGSWRASVRYAHVVVNHHAADEAIADVLSSPQEDAVAGIFEQAFLQWSQYLSRPNLKKQDKSFKDLWVTREMANDNPDLRFQYEYINKFKEALIGKLESADSSSGLAGDMLRHWNQSVETRRAFVDMVVERFFIGDRWQATQEFRERSSGSYGLVVRTSLQNDGVTIFSKAQGMAVGYNLKNKYFAFASDPLVLQGEFGNKGSLEELFILDPRENGEVMDVGFSPAVGLNIRVYSSQKKRDLEADEIEERLYALNVQNPYYMPPVEYTNPDQIVDEDLNRTTQALAQTRLDWENPKSFNDRSAESMARLLASRQVEKYLKDNSPAYKTIYLELTRNLRQLENECSQGGCSEEQKQFLEEQANKPPFESAMARYIEEEADKYIAQEADKIVSLRITGGIRTNDLYQSSLKTNEGIRYIVERQINIIMDSLKNNFEKALLKWQKKEKIIIQTGSYKKLDLFIPAYENSLWLGENFKNILLTLMPGLQIETTSSNKLLQNPFQFGIDRRTIALILSKSGSTFPSLTQAGILNKMTGGNTFVMTSRMDSMISLALGQRLRPDSPFSERIFLTGNYYPAESATISEVLLFANQIELAIYLAQRLRSIFPDSNPWGLRVNNEDIRQLEVLRDNIVNESRRITGVDEQGRRVKNDTVYQALIKQGDYLSSHLLETPKVNYLFRLFVFGVFIFGAPIHNILKFLGLTPGAALESLAGFAVASADAILAMAMPFLITSFLYRTWSKRPRWARMGSPTMVIGDMPALNQTQEAYVSKLGAYAIPSMTMNVHGGNPEDHFGARFAHRIVRGTQIISGLPADEQAKAAYVVTLKQAHGIRNGIFSDIFNSGAEVTTIGRGAFDNKDASDHHIDIGGQPMDAKATTTVKRFDYFTFDPMGRMLAYKVMFNRMYSKASTFTLIPALTVNLGLFKVNVEPRRFSIWNRAWTYPSISVHTTRSPIGGDEKHSQLVDQIQMDNNDNAMVSSQNEVLKKGFDKGGIDMNSRLMKLNITGESGNRIRFDDHAQLGTVIKGIVPQVSNIVTVTPEMLKDMLGEGYLN